MKRAIAAVAAVLCAALVFGAGQGDSKAAQKQKIKVVFNDTGFQANIKWMQDMKALFEKQRPDVEVELVPILGSDQDYVNKTSLMLKSDSSVDVMVIDGFLLPSFVAPGYIAKLPVSDWADWSSQFTDGIKKGVTIGGATYAVPFSTDTRGLHYNLEVFAKAGIPTPWQPKSWADVRDAAMKLKGVVDFPIWMNGSIAQAEATTMQTFEMLLSGTNDWIIEGDKWVASSKGMKDALEFIASLYVQGGLLDSKKMAMMLDANGWQSLNAKFPKGEVGIVLDGNWKGNDWVKESDYMKKIAVTAMPKQNGGGFTSMSGGWTIGVPALSKKQALGFEFIKTAVGYEGHLAACAYRGDMAVRKDVAAAEPYRKENYYRAVMSDYVAFTNFRPGVEAYPQISQQISTAVEAVITGEKTPADALKEYSANVKKIAGEGHWVEK